MSYTRERFNAGDTANSAFSGLQADYLRKLEGRIKRGIPYATAVDLRDFYMGLGSGSDYSAVILRAATEARNAQRALFISGKRYIDSDVDVSSLFGVTILGVGHNASPAFDGQATQIIQRSSNKGILKTWGPCTIENIYFGYATQQTTSDTASIALSINNTSGACFRNIKIYNANTSLGIPQGAFGATTYNTLFDSSFSNIQSYQASECHYDFRNYSGGGTNVELDGLYINGGGSLDFVTAGQRANYGIRGVNWYGWRIGTVSIDGMEFAQRLWDFSNCWFTAAAIRAEGVTVKKNNDGWINLGGSDTSGTIDYAEFRNCRALTADVTTSFLFRCNATEYRLSVGQVNVTTDCTFTSATVRPLQIAGSPTQTGSHIDFGPIGAGAGTFAPTIWTDSVSGVRIVRRWNGFFVSELLKQYQSNAQTLHQSDSAAPGAGTWAVGDRTSITAPGDLGRPVQEICTTAGTPGTWVPSMLAGMFPFSTQGDADVTLTPRSSRFTHRFGTTLTANRTVTLSTTNAWNGCWFLVTRTAGGDFTLDVGGLATLLHDEWAMVGYDGSSFRLIMRGELSHVTANPAQITADQNDYGTLAADTLRLSTDASHNITGLAGGSSGRRLQLINVGSFNLVLQNQNAGSSATNRIITGTAADITVAPDDVVSLWYDGTTTRWRVVSHY